ncbi:MAG: hypothetical protein IJ190_11335 [Prevotella sp.]|nr:hypothetical protein [Prevotella sp.]
MASLNNMEMASALSQHQHINIKKGFLGLSKTVIYTPTNAVVDLTVQEYTPDAESRLVQLLNAPADKLETEVKKGQLVSVPVGHLRLEIALARDRHFLALQLFRFTDFSYSAITGPKFYEDQQADLVANIL